MHINVDIGNRDEVQEIIEKIQRDVGEVTMLVNNGLFYFKLFYII